MEEIRKINISERFEGGVFADNVSSINDLKD